MAAALVGVGGSLVGSVVGGTMAMKAATMQWERGAVDRRREVLRGVLVQLMEDARRIRDDADAAAEGATALLRTAQVAVVLAGNEHHLFHALMATNSLLQERRIPLTAATVERAAASYLRTSESWLMNPDGFRWDDDN